MKFYTYINNPPAGIGNMLLDALPAAIVAKSVEHSRRELGRRLPVHMVHRWWSRRFAATYRMLLASYLFDSEEDLVNAMAEPASMRAAARGRVFFEPMMGGGTGVTEAVLAGWDAYGVDVNPVAVLAASASAYIAARGLPEGFAGKASAVLSEAIDRVKDLWRLGDGLVCHIFVSRGRAPTWLSVNRGKLVALCPRCLLVFESASETCVCPSCGAEFKAEMKPVVDLPGDLPEEAPGWRAFAVEVRYPNGEQWARRYVSARSPQLKEWISATSAKAREMVERIEVPVGEELSALESTRLHRAGIRTPLELFTPRQVVTFAAYAAAAKPHKGVELAFLAAAASEAAKSCTLLAKWYPRLGEVTPAGGVKAHWVPEYTAAVNPLACEPRGLRTLARGTIASSLRAQLRAAQYAQRLGGPSGARYEVSTGDACEVDFPPRIDLAVVDPPYGRVKSYTSLSAPHFYSLRLFEALTGAQFTNGAGLKDVEAREASPRSTAFPQTIARIAEKIASRLQENGRVVLMYSAANPDEWARMLSAFKSSGLYPCAVYWVLGEPPSGITTSKLRGMHLVVFAKHPPQTLHSVIKEPLLSASHFTKLSVELEELASRSLLQALEQVYTGLKAE